MDIYNKLIELGIQKIRRKGQEIMFSCPFHTDNHPSAAIHTGKGLFGCYSCQNRGVPGMTVKQFFDKLGTDFDPSFFMYEDDFQIPQEDIDWDTFKRESETSYDYALTLFDKCFPLSYSIRSDTYMRKRLGKSYKLPPTVDCRYHLKRDSLFFKTDHNIVEKPLKGKYINYGNPVHLFMCLDPSIKYDYIVLVEGVFDSLSAYQINIPCCAFLRSDINQVQISDLYTLKFDYLVVSPDNDSVGKQSAQKVMAKLMGYFPIYATPLIKGKKDFGEMTFKQIKYLVDNKQSIIDLYIERLNKE